MITPHSPNEYPWGSGAIIAQVLALAPASTAELQEAAIAIAVEAFSDPYLRRLCRCAVGGFGDALPDALPDLAIWCAEHLASGPRGIGVALGALAHVFGHRGWAVVAAAAAVGEAADRMPTFDDLVAAVGNELDRELAVAIEPLVTACPPTVAGLAGSPPGHERVREALGTLSRAITELELPIAVTPAGGLERAWVAALAAEPRAAFASRSSAAERAELATAILDLTRTWTWSEVEAWRVGDPFVGVRAIARAHGLGVWLEAFESVGADVATSLEAELHESWELARTTAYAALPAPANDQLVSAIAALARSAGVTAARLIGDRLAAGRPIDAGWITELLGDPREHPELWRDAAPAVIAAMEHR